MKEDFFYRGFFSYKDQRYLTYKCKLGSFGFGIASKDISEWKSTGIIQVILI